MARNIQIRNVPDALHRKLKARAASEGMTLSAFILRELEWLAEIPSQDELLARLARQRNPDLEPTAAELVRLDRDIR